MEQRQLYAGVLTGFGRDVEHFIAAHTTELERQQNGPEWQLELAATRRKRSQTATKSDGEGH